MNYLSTRQALFAFLVVLAVVPSMAISQDVEIAAPETPSTETDEPITVTETQATAAASAEKLPPEGSEKTAIAEEEAPLRVWNRHIVQLRAVVAGLQPDERASLAVARITDLSDALLLEKVWAEPARIRGIDFILTGVQDNVLVGLRQEDLDPTSDQTLEELGAEVAGRIQLVLKARSEQRHWPTVLRGIGLSSAATVVFVLLMWGILRLRSGLASRLTRRLTRLDVHLSGFDLRPYLRNLVRGSVGFISWGLILPIGYLWLTFVLKRFPFTRPWGRGLGNYLIDLLTDLFVGALGTIPGLFTVFLIFLFTRFLTRIVAAFFISVESEALHVHWLQPETAKATRRLIIVVMWLFALTVAYPYIPGSNSSAFRGVSVFVGLMVSLGATGLVNQIVSGMVIVYTRAFRPGEYVRIGDTEGIVEEIGVLSTKVSNRRREEITIPNAVLIGVNVTNFSRQAGEQGAVISTAVTIGYDVPWRQVHALLEQAADHCPGVRQEPKPLVLQKGLSDFYVEYSLIVHIDDPAERFVVISELHGQIQDTFNEHDVQILSPHYLDRTEEPVVVPKDEWAPPPADPDST